MEKENKQLKYLKELLGFSDKALSALKNGQKLEGKDSALTPLI